MHDLDLPREFRLDDAITFAAAYRRALDQGFKKESFRELFHGLTSHSSPTTVTNHLSRLVTALLPPGGVAGTHGDRQKLLFAQKDGTVEATPLGHLLYKRLEAFGDYWSETKVAAALAHKGMNPPPSQVRIGAPPALALRLLPLVFSAPAASMHDGIRPETTYGNVELDLLPRVLLGTLDFVVGYGPVGPGPGRTPNDRGRKTARPAKPLHRTVCADPLTPGVSFADLDSPFEMVLICHPSSPVISEKSEEDGWTTAGDLDASLSDSGSDITLIVSAARRQCEGVQDLVDKARRRGLFREVETDDEGLALVRTDGGVALVPEVFEDRQGIKSCRMEPSSQFQRRLGIYFSTRAGLSGYACWFAEFLRAYMKVYNEHRAKPDQYAHRPPAYTRGSNYPQEVIGLMPEKVPADGWRDFFIAHYKTA